MAEEALEEIRKRILAPFQAQRGVQVWAPWGPSGWSAVVISKSSRKWAKGRRVKPTTGKEISDGKIPLDRLIKRDLKLKGKDRPTFTPDEVFAHRKVAESEVAPELEKTPEPVVEKLKSEPLPNRSEAESLRRVKKIFKVIGDDSFDDDDDDW